MTDDCDCVCNHSGACTGCGICYLTAYYDLLQPLPAGTGDGSS